MTAPSSLQTTDTAQLKQLLADSARCSIDEAAAFVDALVATLTERLQAGEEVQVQGLGTFRVVATLEGHSRRVAFVPDVRMRQAVNEPFACFEPVVITERPAAVAVAAPPAAAEALPLAVGAVAPPDVPLPASEAEEIPAPEPVEPIAPLSASDPEAPASEAGEIAAPEPTEPTARPKAGTTSRKKAVWIDDDEEVAEERRLGVWVWGSLVVVLLLLVALVLWILLSGRDDFKRRNGNIRMPAEAVAPEAEAVGAADDTVLTAVASTDTATAPRLQKPSDGAPSPAVAAPQPVPSAPEAAASQPVAPEPPPAAPAPPAQPTADMLLRDGNGRPVVTRLNPGERLALLALSHYGDKVFWGYIYKVNAHRLKDPNNVSPNVDLYLPDPTYWKIDKDNATSRQRAARLNAELLTQ